WYEAIRKCNILINNIDVVPYRTTYTNALGEVKPLNVSMKAEARFLRAFFYFQLLERYGGIPLIGDNVFDLNDDLEIPRNTFEDCVNYIVSELDTIKNDLRPTSSAESNYVHAANTAACEALKIRVLLYAASPLYNGQTLENGNPYVGYTDYDVNRWKLAADAAREFIATKGKTGTSTTPSVKFFQLKNSLRDAFLNHQGASNYEMIFFRNSGKESTSVETNNGPLGFTGSKLGNGRTNPTQNLVDAFPMLDGKKIGESTKYPYDPQHPYDNRDPRLDYTILHNGSQWLNTLLDTHAGGANNPSSTGHYSQTSYFMGKFMGDHKTATEYASHKDLWVYFRYAEILLNFAEAENEVNGPTDDVINALVHIRKRAGIEAGTGAEKNKYGINVNMTKDEMREFIHNERRIEMAFEEQRYYDIRRWREAEKIFASPLKGMSIIVSSTSTVYNVVDVLKVDWSDKMYLYPIPYTEVNKNRNMVQNPNWK
ncbi:MAG: RagB/SusD family nutrient uptake outer membrane protein, partial [Prevotellaceae bacterium]|nr:RagB/SusD family nutrient uptake outer membrane protein [Prevotellaceae bacterium]